MGKLQELQTKLDELKQVEESQLTEDQKKELAALPAQIQETEKAVNRYKELSEKDENLLTSEEVDEYLTLSESFGEADIEGKGDGKPADKKKYAGIYDTVEALVEGFKSSEAERKRIESDPDAIKAIEDEYKDSQRKVTKLVADRKARPRVEPNTKPLNMREFGEMTKEEYDV